MTTHTGKNKKVELTIENGVADLLLSDPDKRNCFSQGLAADLFELTSDHLVNNDAVDVVAITGKGPIFCAGADMEIVRGNDPKAMDAVHDDRRAVFRWIRDGPVPIIAGGHGAIVGLGAYLFVATDLRVMGVETTMWYPEIEYGISTVEEGVYLAERIGIASALEMLLMGQDGGMRANRAREMGLANRVVDEENVRESTLAMAATIADITNGHDIAEDLLTAMKHVRREQVGGALSSAVEAQERARFGDAIATSGKSVYDT